MHSIHSILHATPCCECRAVQGIQNGWTLPEPCNIDPVGLPGAVRLPKSLAEAIQAFDSCAKASWASYIRSATYPDSASTDTAGARGIAEPGDPKLMLSGAQQTCCAKACLPHTQELCRCCTGQ